MWTEQLANEQPDNPFRTDSADQYSLPTCQSDLSSSDYSELGPSTTQLLGILQALDTL